MSEDELRDNDRIYQNLMHLHRQEHIGEDCFCTTEVSGVYKNVMNELQRIALESRIDTIDNYLKQCRMLRTEPSSRSLELFSDELKAQLTNLDNSNNERIGDANSNSL